MQTTHTVNGRALYENYPAGTEQALFAMGCFWGAERLFWQMGGVYVTSVGYGGGKGANPTYEQVCSGATGHGELVHVVFSPDILPYSELLKQFFENHDPTQGNRQGGDIGSQYRSMVFYYTPEQIQAANAAKARYAAAYKASGKNPLTTEILPVPDYYPAEDYHQQYLAKNPGGYCNIGGTGISCPVPAPR